jgi:3D (Asp-Asp-Asp) domain-containing protein
MRKIKITLVIIALSLFINELTHNTFKTFIFKRTNTEVKKVNTYEVTATMYYPVSSQCDSDPLVTAGMYKIIPGKASEQKWIAMSRDMIARWGGEFHYGDIVQISGAGHKDGVYKVVDTMNKRFKNRIDFLEDKGTKHYKFENVKIWKTQTPQENLLASL